MSDPVEEQKIMAPPKKPIGGSFFKKPAMPEVRPSQPSQPPVLKVVTAPVEAPPQPPAKRYVVKKDRNISLNGSLTCMRAGQVIDPLGYAAGVVENLVLQGVELEEIQ